MFLAYFREDAHYANDILEDLTKAGLTSYSVEIKTDRDYTPDADYDAMTASKIIATVTSRQAWESEWFKVLYSESWAMQKVMIPFLVNCQYAVNPLPFATTLIWMPIQFDEREDLIKELSQWLQRTDT